MVDALDAFLADFGALPWAWGKVDCTMAIAAWTSSRGYPDLLEPFRGRYADQAGSERLIREQGSLKAAIAGQAILIGLAPTERVLRGAIGVIGSPARSLRQWCAIHDGDRWQVRTPTGFDVVAAPILAMWRV